MLALVNVRVLLDEGFVPGCAVLIDGERIVAVPPVDALPPGVPQEDLNGAMLVPGFIDTQVNGGGGMLFNDAPSVETIRAIAAAHARFGTTGMLPTLITDELDVIRAAIAAVDAAIEQRVPGILGIHVEGPFINTKRKGIHAADRIRTMDAEGFGVLTSLRHGRVLVTMAPEMVDPAMITRLVAAGVIVSAGHTAATYAEVNCAIDAGLSGFTHLFNAMSPLTSREPGVVGAALESDASWCAVIVDGHHVSPATLRLALRCKPPDRIMLVTDAMPTTGDDRPGFMLQGRRIHRDAGRLVADDGTLAGSDLDMASAVSNAHRMLHVPLERAFAMAARTPAAFLGLEHSLGRIAPGYRASLTAVDDTLTTVAAYADGLRTA